MRVLHDALEADELAVAACALSWEVRTRWIDKPNGRYREMMHLVNPHMRGPFTMERLLHENLMPIQSVLFRRSLFEREGGFDETLDQLEDWNLWVRYGAHGTFAHVPKLTSIYRTPDDENERHQRHLALHAAYEKVRSLNVQSVVRIKRTLEAGGRPGASPPEPEAPSVTA